MMLQNTTGKISLIGEFLPGKISRGKMQHPLDVMIKTCYPNNMGYNIKPHCYECGKQLTLYEERLCKTCQILEEYENKTWRRLQDEMLIIPESHRLPSDVYIEGLQFEIETAREMETEEVLLLFPHLQWIRSSMRVA